MSVTEANAPADSIPSKFVLGTRLQLTTYEEFGRHCLELARRPGVRAVDFSNTQIVTMRRHEPSFASLTRRTDYFVPDGMPLIWCLNFQGARLRDRVYGPAFMKYLVSGRAVGFNHYFLGGSQECVSRLCANFRRWSPQVNIVGSHHGYFQPEDEAGVIEEINRLSPDFIWVGLGTPKQQAWIERNRDRLAHGVILAVGFAFDVNAGTKPDAPGWMQKLGLTWVFRMASEPRRLGPRFLRYNSLFLFYLIWDALRGRAFAPAPESNVS